MAPSSPGAVQVSCTLDDEDRSSGQVRDGVWRMRIQNRDREDVIHEQRTAIGSADRDRRGSI